MRVTGGSPQLITGWKAGRSRSGTDTALSCSAVFCFGNWEAQLLEQQMFFKDIKGKKGIRFHARACHESLAEKGHLNRTPRTGDVPQDLQGRHLEINIF